VEATDQAAFLVVDAGRRYAWQVRRVGERDPRSSGHGTRAQVVLRAPGGTSGLYLFEVQTARRRTEVPFAVQAAHSEPVLVVLPATTWQGRNRADDDGDGWPDTLDGGRAVRTARAYAGGQLPTGVVDEVAPLLIALDRAGLRYDITTDIALARGDGQPLRGHTGVVLAGDFRWLDTGVQSSLRTWVRRGGRLLETGTDSLRRSVDVTPNELTRPTQPTARDLFGVRLRALAAAPDTIVTNTVDRIGLFRGTDGQFGPFSSYEATISIGPSSRVLAVASTADARSDVIVAYRFGRGVVVRTGLPELPARLSSDPELVDFLKRTWTLLRFR
jgi:hypothetical protein